MQKNGRRSRPFFHVLVLTRTIETRCKQAYKPGSVLTAIYLDLPLPISSSHLLGTAGQASCSPTVLLRIEFTGPSSYLTCPPFPAQRPAVSLWCTCPKVAFGGCYPLSSPYGARTFLIPGPFAPGTRLSSFLAPLFYPMTTGIVNLGD